MSICFRQTSNPNSLSKSQDAVGGVDTVVGVGGLGFGGFKLFESQKLTIDDTANVVTEIKKISEFTSACYYEELVLVNSKEIINKVKKSVIGTVIHQDSISKKELVIIAKGKVRAGFDLSEIAEDDLHVKADTLTINLAPAKIFDIIINPSGYEMFVEEGSWSHEEVTAIQSEAKEKIEKNAIEDGLLDKATKYGKEKLTNLFKTFGFNEVIINIPEKEDTAAL